MLQETKDSIVAHAKAEFPREACGLIINDAGHETYLPCRNLAENQRDFILDPTDYAVAEDLGDILAVVHSHPNAPAAPSQADRVGCEATQLPWHIVSIPSESWAMITPTGYRAPLLGREFVHGVLDCYSLIRDWYREERGIDLPDFERREEWWTKGENLYIENFGKAGFVPVDPSEIQCGDVMIMQIMSKVPNHAGIYLGRDVMLHHLMRRLSCRETYNGYWKKNTRLVIRYQGTP